MCELGNKFKLHLMHCKEALEESQRKDPSSWKNFLGKAFINMLGKMKCPWRFNSKLIGKEDTQEESLATVTNILCFDIDLDELEDSDTESEIDAHTASFF